MIVFAASALEKASKVPSSFWLKVVLCIVAFVLVVLLLRWLAQANKVLMMIVGAAIFAVTGFQWIYERNEPEFLTPVVDAIAPFFPSKGAYEETQKSDPKTPGLKKSSGPRPTPAKR